MSKTNWIQRLTPEQAWNELVDQSVELFVSSFYSEGYTDITDACKRYSEDIPSIYERPFLQEQLDHIAKLLEQHINDYISKIGGPAKLRIYTDEELDEIYQEEVDNLLGILEGFKISTMPNKRR